MSTQMTSLPLSAKHVPATRPTYPVPITHSFTYASVLREVLRRYRPLVAPSNMILSSAARDGSARRGRHTHLADRIDRLRLRLVVGAREHLAEEPERD